MSDIDAGDIFDTIGEILFDMRPEITELIEEKNVSKGIINRLKQLERDTIELREYVYKEYYEE